jgi:hypothetical protein
LEGLAMQDFGLFMAIWSTYFTAIWYVLWPFVLFYGQIDFLWTFGIFYGYLVYFFRFGILYPKNLATLQQNGSAVYSDLLDTVPNVFDDEITIIFAKIFDDLEM